jgi:hypothetical protein
MKHLAFAVRARRQHPGRARLEERGAAHAGKAVAAIHLRTGAKILRLADVPGGTIDNPGRNDVSSARNTEISPFVSK